MAKLSSSQKKPNGQTILRHSAVRRFLAGRNFTDIRNLGGKLGRALAEEYGSEAVEKLLRVPLPTMQAKFGDEVIWVYNLIRGIDETALASRTLPKSMLASKNVLPAMTDISHGATVVKLLAGELALRLREARELSPHLWAKTLVLSWRIGFGYGVNNVRSKQCGFPRLNVPDEALGKSPEELEVIQHQTLENLIAKLGQRMWEVAAKGIWGTKLHGRGGRIQITTVSLIHGLFDRHWLKRLQLAMAFTGVQRQEEGQKGIEAFLRVGKPEEEDTVTLLPDEEDKELEHEDKGSSAALLDINSSTTEIIDEEAKDVLETEMDVRAQPWKCPRCQEWLDVEADLVDDHRIVLDRRKQEHEDLHAAMDLQASFDTIPSARPTESTAKRKRVVQTSQLVGTAKRKQPPHDIRSYLRPG